MATRWGILSAGKIAHDFTLALSSPGLESSHKAVAVAARDLSRAQQFAKTHKITKAYGSYKELAEDKNVGMFVAEQL